MSISFYDFSRLHDSQFQEEVHLRFRQILSENSFIEGKYNELLEKELSSLLGAKWCKLVANGTDALEIALKLYDVGPGDTVAVPGITFYATAEAVVNVGATGVIVDVDPKTGLLDPASLERVYKTHPFKAVMPVHIYGLPAPIEAIEKFCEPKGIKIIEDAAQAIGTLLPRHPVGGGKNLTTLSFYPTKNLGAMGDAGAILTQDDEMAQKITSYRNHGRSPQGLQFFGRNSRCDHLQAAVLHLKLADLSRQNEARKKVAGFYLKDLASLVSSGKISIPGEKFIPSSSWHLFPILLGNEREKFAVRDLLKQNDISTMTFYEKSLGDEKPVQSWPGEREVARRFAEGVLCLPIHPFLSEKDVSTIGDVLRNFFSRK